MPKEYLVDYYSAVEQDEVETIAFFVDAMKHVDPDEPILYFGVGPTLHHVFLTAGKASEIHLGDYLPANLTESGGSNAIPTPMIGVRSFATRSNAKGATRRPRRR